MWKSVSLTYVVTIASMLSVVTGEKCGYVPGPLASTPDTVVIRFDCKQSTPLSHSVPSQLHDSTTHVAVQLLHCHSVPLGLFTNVSDNLASVTIASDDAAQLLEGTFDGLEHVTELRLLGFSSLINMSVSLFEPLRNIEALILDGFGRAHLKFSRLGSAIQKLTNTPIERLVFNDMRDLLSGKLLEDRTIRADDFKIINASVKELIISKTSIHYEGSIRRAFPHLTCFYGSKGNVESAKSLPVMWDLALLSDTLNTFIFHKYAIPSEPLPNMTANEMYAVFSRALAYYPDLLSYAFNRPAAKGCALGHKLRLGANISRMDLYRLKLTVENLNKPICWEQNNKLQYLDLTRCPFPEHFVGFRGLSRLEYLSLANTQIKSLSNDFLHYFPALQTLKLSQLDIGNFIKSVDGNFFAFNAALTEIHLDNCQLTDISASLILALINYFQPFRISNASTFNRDVESGFRNSTNLKLLNFSSNSIRVVSQNSTSKLNELIVSRPKGSELLVDLRYNELHCLCNSTHFVKWLQRSGLQADSEITFPGFDNYRCLYPNGSIVRVSEVIVSELKQQCSVLQTLVNGSDCPCDNELRRRIERVWMSLDGLFCRNDAGDLVAMKNRPLPSCFNPYLRASFVVPVVLGGMLGITVLITVGLLIYYRNSRRVKQVRDCLEMNPVHFVRTALQYVMMNNREEEHEASFDHQIFLFAQDEDQTNIHTHFLTALQEHRSVITRDNFLPGTVEVDEIVKSIHNCQWIVPVLTLNFLSDPECALFVSRVQFNRPHALIPVVWEQPLAVTDVAVEDLLRTADPLYWPGDMAADEQKQNFWAALRERTIPL